MVGRRTLSGDGGRSRRHRRQRAKKDGGTENREGWCLNYPAPSFLRTQLLAMLVYSLSDIIESDDEDIDSDIADPRASSDSPLPICSRRR